MRQLLLAGDPTTSVGTGTKTYAPTGYGDNASNWVAVAPISGTLRNLYFSTTTAPGAGTSRAATLFKNGSTTALASTISNTDTSSSDTSNSVTVSAGDYLYFQQTTSGSVASTVGLYITCEFQPDTAQRYALFQSYPIGIQFTASKQYAPGFNRSFFIASSTTNGHARALVPHDATITDFYVRLTTAPSAGNSCVLSIYKNGIEEASTQVTISDTNTTGSVTGLSVNVSPGDYLSIGGSSANTPAVTTFSCGIGVQPDTDTEFTLASGDPNNVAQSSSSTTYVPVGAHQIDNGTTESAKLTFFRFPYASLLLKNLYVRLSSAPGSGKSRQMIVRKNSASTDLTATVSDTSVVASDTVNTVSVSNGDSVDFSNTPTGSPSGTGTRNFAVVATIIGASASASISLSPSQSSSVSVSASPSSSASSSVSLSPSSSASPSASVSSSPSLSQSPSSSVSLSPSPSQSVSSSVSKSPSSSQSPSSSRSSSVSSSVSLSQSPSSSPSASASNSPSASPSASPSPVQWTNDNRSSTSWINDSKSQL